MAGNSHAGSTQACQHQKRIASNELSGFQYFSVLDARGANSDPLGAFGNYGADFLQVDVPTPLGDVMCVTYFVAELRAAAAFVAYFCRKTEISRRL